MSAVRIAVRNLTVRFGEVLALDRVSLDVPVRGLTALIGPSGSGKSTLLRALNRMTETTRGASIEGIVALDGRDVLARGVDAAKIRRRFGVIAQKADPFPRSIFDNVAYGPRLHRLARTPETLAARVREALERTGLWEEVEDVLHERASTLSVGQQQRLCIARAIAYAPEIILADEPCSALDAPNAALVEHLLAELARERTVVLATHRLAEAERIADHAAYLEAGAIVEAAPAAVLFSRPHDPRTAAFLAAPRR